MIIGRPWLSLIPLILCLAVAGPAFAQEDKEDDEDDNESTEGGDLDWGDDSVPTMEGDEEESDKPKPDAKDGDPTDEEGKPDGEEGDEDGPDAGRATGDGDDIDDWSGEIEKQDMNQTEKREEVKVEVEAEPERIGISGNWYQVGVDCLYCESILGQNLEVSEAEVMRQFFDHLQIEPSAKAGKMVFPSEGINRPFEVVKDDTRVILFMYAIDVGDRSTALYCTIWDLQWLLRDEKLLYGRRYSVDAYQPFAFGTWEKGYKADETFLPMEQLRTFLDLSPVQDLSEEGKVFAIGDKAVLTYLGSDAFVRSDFEEEPYADLQARLFKEKVEFDQREKDRRVSYDAGVEAFEDRDYDTALEQFGKAGELGEDSVDFHFYFGAAYQGKKQYDKAIDHYRIVLAKDQRDTTTRFNLAMILEKQGRLREALDEYNIILKYDKDDDEAKDRAFNLMLQMQE